MEVVTLISLVEIKVMMEKYTENRGGDQDGGDSRGLKQMKSSFLERYVQQTQIYILIYSVGSRGQDMADKHSSRQPSLIEDLDQFIHLRVEKKEQTS